MALEVIANGAEWEPGTKTARLALVPPEVAENPFAGMSLREAVDEARAEDMAHETPDDDLDESEETTQEPDEPEDDDPEPVEPAEAEEEKPGRVREKVGEDGLTDTQRAMLTLIRERGEANVAMIRAAVEGLTDAKLRRGLRLLRDRGEIVAEGHSDTTTYKPAAPASMNTPTMPDPEPAALKPLRRAAPAPSEKPTGTDEGRVLESVRFKRGWSIAQHASRLDLHTDKVSVAMRKLEAEGEVKGVPRNGRVVWVVR